MLILFFAFILITSFLLALAEIQIEGKFGWAKKLPTWRKKISIGKFKFEITGYHLFFFGGLFAMLQFRFVFQPFTIKDELLTISAYLFMVIVEDFLWFLLNPNYGLRKYNKKFVYWYQTWFLGFPIIYFFFIPLAILLLFIYLNI